MYWVRESYWQVEGARLAKIPRSEANSIPTKLSTSRDVRTAPDSFQQPSLSLLARPASSRRRELACKSGGLLEEQEFQKQHRHQQFKHRSR